MMSLKDISASSTGSDRGIWSWHALRAAAEREQSDRRAGHEYVPMDLYIDPQERRAHFSVFAVQRRL